MDLTVKIHKREYRYPTEARCHTCSSQYRAAIEVAVMDSFLASLTGERLSAGSTRRDGSVNFAAVSRAVPEAEVSAASVRLHFRRRHHPWLTIVRQAVMADRATMIGRQIASIGEDESRPRHAVAASFTPLPGRSNAPTAA